MILLGDCIEVLREMEAGSVHCCVTSPPYWGLRDYGSCDCGSGRYTENQGKGTGGNLNYRTNRPLKQCIKCKGTGRIIGTDSQLGLEDTPEAYTERMVDVFREVHRVLRDDGTLWLNLGDSYAHSGPCGGSSPDGPRKPRATDKAKQEMMGYKVPPGLKAKDLIGIPWRVAFALQADGWWLRSDIIWAKPSPMPESVTDRPTKSHEHIFLLSKSKKYYYDAEAIREDCADERMGNPGKYKAGLKECETPMGVHGNGVTGQGWNSDGQTKGRNKRDVWTVATAPYSEAHFATFPPKLIEPCILAGTSEKGSCPDCGKPWDRVVEKSIPEDKGRSKDAKYTEMGGQFKRRLGQQYQDQLNNNPSKTTGWEPTCKCPGLDGDSPGSDCADDDNWPVIPCTVLDPFAGAGTTGLVSSRLGRNFIGIELNPEYCEMARRRIYDDAPLFNEII